MLDNQVLLEEGVEKADPSEYLTAIKTNQQNSLRKNDGVIVMVVVAAWISLSSETCTSSKVSSILCLKIIHELQWLRRKSGKEPWVQWLETQEKSRQVQVLALKAELNNYSDLSKSLDF